MLGEQVDNSTLKPNWVIGLGWSHAMFIIVLEKLYKNNLKYNINEGVTLFYNQKNDNKN